MFQLFMVIIFLMLLKLLMLLMSTILTLLPPPSRDTSPTHMVHSPESSHSCGSLNVLPNNSPAPSTEPGSLDNPPSPMSVQSNPASAPNTGSNSREATPPVVEEVEEVQVALSYNHHGFHHHRHHLQCRHCHRRQHPHQEEFVQPSPVSSTAVPKGENTSRGIDSEIFSRGNSSNKGNSRDEQPPHKVYIIIIVIIIVIIIIISPQGEHVREREG